MSENFWNMFVLYFVLIYPASCTLSTLWTVLKLLPENELFTLHEKREIQINTNIDKLRKKTCNPWRLVNIIFLIKILIHSEKNNLIIR